jgi:hypothetical protein
LFLEFVETTELWFGFLDLVTNDENFLYDITFIHFAISSTDVIILSLGFHTQQILRTYLRYDFPNFVHENAS